MKSGINQVLKPKAYQISTIDDINHEIVALDYAIYNPPNNLQQSQNNNNFNSNPQFSILNWSIDQNQMDRQGSLENLNPQNNSRDQNNNQQQISMSKEKKKVLKQSESFRALVDSNAIQNNIELCEVFVVVGVHQDTLRLHLQEIARGERIMDNYTTNALFHNLDTSIEKANPYQDSDHHMSTTPQILDSYPKILKNNLDFNAVLNSTKNESQSQMLSTMNEQYLYLSNIQLICFPDGYYVDTDFNREKMQELISKTHNGYSSQESSQNYKIMHFTITQSSGDKKYLTSIQYNELAYIEYQVGNLIDRKVCILPKCICIVSRLPLFSIQKQMLEFLYDDLILKFHQAFSDDYKDSDDFKVIEQKFIKAKQIVKFDRLEFYLSTFFHHLKIDGTNLEFEIKLLIKLKILVLFIFHIYKYNCRYYISLYKKSSKIMNNNNKQSQHKKTLIRYVNTFNKECLKLENYDFKLLFEKIRPKMLMQMFVSLLHERKIIIIHNDSGKNAILIETLISLLYPLQWNFTNISYLIPSMVEYLEAPFPYIVGVPRDLWKFIYEQKWEVLGEEVVAFDIDNNRVLQKEDLPDFPQPYTQLLIQQLEIQIDKSKQLSARTVERDTELSREIDRFWNNFTLKVKQQFLNFLIFLINTFENFYIQQEETVNKGSMIQSIGMQGTASSTLDSSRIHHQQNSVAGGGSANDIFNFEEYVQNVTENQSFFEKFVRTQAFINFIEQAYYEEQGNLSDASIRFFKECTRKLSKENLQAVRAMQDTMIQNLQLYYIRILKLFYYNSQVQ